MTVRLKADTTYDFLNGRPSGYVVSGFSRTVNAFSRTVIQNTWT